MKNSSFLSKHSVAVNRKAYGALRDLLALFGRYGISMQQLAQFQNSGNESWFTSPPMYWHKKVFGPQTRQLLKPKLSIGACCR